MTTEDATSPTRRPARPPQPCTVVQSVEDALRTGVIGVPAPTVVDLRSPWHEAGRRPPRRCGVRPARRRGGLACGAC